MTSSSVQEEAHFWHGLRSDALWQLAERGTRVGLGFALSVVIARTLGPAEFGTYSYALATVALFAFLGQAGLDALLIREIVRAPSRATHILSEGLILRLGGAACAAAGSICIAILFASSKTPGSVALVSILSLTGLLQAGWIVESLLLANRRFAGVALSKMFAYMVAAALRLIALLFPNPLIALAIVAVLESFFCVAFLWHVSRNQLGVAWNSLEKPDFRNVSALAKLAAPMLLSAFTIAVYSRIDIFMLGRMAGSEAAGLYTAGTLLSEGFYLIPAAVMAAASPRLARLYVLDARTFDGELHGFLRILSALGLAIAIVVTLVGPLVLPWLFGSRYVAANPVLQIHIWSTWAVFVSTASDPYYINYDLRRLYLIKTSVAAAINVALNFALIPKYGPVGAAWATLVAYATSAILIGALSPQTRPLFTMQIHAIAGLSAKRPSAWSTRE